MKQKKPTMNEMRNAINNLAQWIKNIESGLNQLDLITSLYIKFKGDTKKFETYIKKESKKMKKESEGKNVVLSDRKSKKTNEDM